jgi:calcineurin-like phosphoesterase family protein
MSRNVFLISDTHFGHINMLNFTRENGEPLRPFSNVDEMNDVLIKNWNSVVAPHDKVYHLGDVTMNATSLDLLHNLNGTKILIKGNHDIQALKYYLPHFKDIRGTHELDGILLSHIPVSESQKSRYRGNVHGHLHDKNMSDPWYYNVSVEQIDYTPIPFEEIQKYYSQKQPLRRGVS